MKKKEREKRLELFIQGQQRAHEGFPDFSDKVMARIREAREPKKPLFFQSILKSLKGTLTLHPTSAWKFAAAVLVLLVSGGLFLNPHRNLTPQSPGVSKGSHVAKGSPFVLKYLVKSKTGDTVLLANNTLFNSPGDIFQAVYWSTRPTHAHLVLIENEKTLQCFTCDSLQGISLKPAQGGYFPFAVELDSNPGKALLAVAVSDTGIDGNIIKKSILDLMENSSLSSKSDRYGSLKTANGIRYFLFRINKVKEDAKTAR